MLVLLVTSHQQDQRKVSICPYMGKCSPYVGSMASGTLVKWSLQEILWTECPHGGSEVMVLAGISYRQLTHLINGNWNAQRYCDNILRPVEGATMVFVIFLIFLILVIMCFSDPRHYLNSQHDNAQPHVARICTIYGILKHSMACLLRDVSHWACLRHIGLMFTMF